MIELILRNISNRKARTFLTVLGVTIGAAAILSLVSVANGLDKQAVDVFQKLQRINVQQENTLLPIFSKVPMSYMEEIEKIEGVTGTSPRILKLVETIDGKQIRESLMQFSGVPIEIGGVIPSREMASPSAKPPHSIVEGRWLNDGDKYAAVIGKPVAKQWNKGAGSTINIDGVDFRVVGVYSTGSDIMDGVIYVPLEVAREIAGLGKNEVSQIWVDVADPTQIDRISHRIQFKLSGVTASTPESVSKEFGDLLNMIKSAAWIITGISGVVGGIGIANTMLMNVMERRREIGIYKAVGWTDREVMSLFIVEAALMGLMGGLIGIGIGYGGLLAAAKLKGVIFYTPIDLVLEVMAFSVSLGIIGGIYPSWRTTQIQPAEALRYE